MSGLKDQVATDRNAVFLALDDFAEMHVVDGAEIVCVIDNDAFKQRSPEVGVESAEVRLFAKSDDLLRKEAGDVVDVDGVLYVVDTWHDDMGVAEVALTAARSAY